MNENTNLLNEEKNELTEQEEIIQEEPQKDLISEESPDGQISPEDAQLPESEDDGVPLEKNPEEEPSDAAVSLDELSEVGEDDSLVELLKKPPYHERYYLRYCGSERVAPLDLEGTKSFLQSIGFDGGELRQAREGKGQAEVFQTSENNKKNQMYCSYCGVEIAGVEYYRLPDTRLRCTACSRSIVSDKEEIQVICKRVIANMDNFFGATIDVPVSIEVLDERKLKKKAGVPLGTRDDKSMLILGVAINKKGKYSILLENGAPRISLIATFAHELTHIWQYTHWDNNKNLKKCPNGNRLIVYEGMAKWAEIQYLYLIGESNVAKREELITLNREDEYGVGFRLYEDQYPLTREAMVCEETPFTPNSYPFD